MYLVSGQWLGFNLFSNNALVKFIVVTALLATVTEVVQRWVPARAFNPMDWISNISGIALGVIIIKIQEGRFKIEE